ncbi:MAG TPA: hypothetical protein PKA10_19715 [Selenomonadales bacterium]|nr:hypothetical protein [Selenomonadales bacterium]
MIEKNDVFIWTISNNGYEWIEGYLYEKSGSAGAEIRVLTDAPQRGTEEPFKHFVRIGNSPQELAEFACQHGPLMSVSLLPRTVLAKHKKHQSLEFWQNEHKDMRLAHNIFQATNEKEAKDIISRFLFINEISQFSGDTNNININSHTELLDAIQRVKAGKSILTLNHVIAISNLDFFNCQKIALTTIVKLFLSRLLEKKMDTYSLRYSMKYDCEKDAWLPSIKPSSLLSFMWYQLGEEISGHQKYKQCRHCGKWENRTGPNMRKDWIEHPWCGANERKKKSRTNIKSQKIGE